MLLSLLQTATTAPGLAAEWPSMVVSSGVAGLVLWFWRQDRADRAVEKKADADRYEALAKDFRQIVQANTEAMTKLSDALATRTVQCPFISPALMAQASKVLAERES